jgi:hypothetical protein
MSTSSATVTQAADIRPPSGATAPTQAQRLAGTGVTEAASATALTGGAVATLLVGGTSIRLAFGGAALGVGSVATTDLVIGANYRFDWYVQADSDAFIAIEAADGATAYEAWVWTSSGPRG